MNVQKFNRQIEGKDYLEQGDVVFCPSNQNDCQVLEIMSDIPNEIMPPRGYKPITEKSKFNPLKLLASLDLQYVQLLENEEDTNNRAVVFGHGDYNNYKKRLLNRALKANKKIRDKYGCKTKDEIIKWAKKHYFNPDSIERKEAWREYMTFNDIVCCIDFTHATTIHKSQGSTHEVVLLDTQSVIQCVKDTKMVLQLVYTGMTRAREQVYSNA